MAQPFLHPTLGPLHLGRPKPSPITRKSMAKAFRVHNFLNTLAPAPDEVDNTRGVTDFGMMLNDSEGDCTCAACGHLLQTWAGITVPDSAIQEEYEKACGYNPSDPSTDQGGIISNVLDYFRDTGVGGYKISAHAEVNITQMRVQQSIYTFGASDLGIQLPASAQNQVGGTWDFVNDTPDQPGGWGGHSVAAVKYDPTGVWCVTWGQLQKMTWRWFMFYCVAPETRILKSDLTWTPAGCLFVGDELMCFDEAGPRRMWKSGLVEAAEEIEHPCFRVTFEDGTQIVCSEEHQWLCSGHNTGYYWVRTDRLRFGKTATHVLKPVDVWAADDTRSGGYLAAAFDGEGSLTQRDMHQATYSVGAAVKNYSRMGANTHLSFSQKSNAMLDKVKEYLDQRSIKVRLSKNSQSGVNVVWLCRRRELLNFMGSIRPHRLLNRFNPNLMGTLSGGYAKAMRVTDCKRIGVEKVIALKTTAKTYIAEGFASHNCDECHAAISPQWSSPVDVSQLVPDLQEIGS